ncbi:MAG: DUF1697 domain-containing protein [Acidimicrobiales bacterium]
MPTYVALLRGVNVGGHHKVAMSELRSLFESMGFSDVQTLIQSGNVVFVSTRAPVAQHLEAAIEDRFAVVSRVVLRTPADLEEVIENAPATMADVSRLHVAFFTDRPAPADVVHLDHERFLPEQFSVRDHDMYVHLPNGAARTKLLDYLSRRLKVPMTMRNWNTVNRLAQLSRGLEPGPMPDVS